MPYEELEHFYTRGEEKAIWILSFKNIGGLFLGGFIGHRIGTIISGEGAGALTFAIIGAIIGICLTFQVRGILALKRIAIKLKFYLRRALNPTVIDSEAIFEIIEETEQPIRVRKLGGETVIAPKRAAAGGK